MDFLFIDTGPSEIIRHLTTPPAAIVQPLEVAPPPVRLACYAYIEGSTPTSCPQTPRSPTGVTETGAGQSPDFNPLNEEGMDDTIFDEETEEELLCYVEQDEEREVDRIAQEIAEAINNLDPSIEHGTFIIDNNGQIQALEIVSGDGNVLPLENLYDQFSSLGIDDRSVVAFIHSHPGTPNLTGASIEADIFANSFPSANDYPSDDDFANNAVAFGADETAWRDRFSAYIISPNGVLREFEEFSLPSSQSFLENNGLIPEIGTHERQSLQNELNNAQADAESRC